MIRLHSHHHCHHLNSSSLLSLLYCQNRRCVYYHASSSSFLFIFFTAPFIEPLNFTVESLIWHTSRANWTLIPSVKIPGICRGYVLKYLRKEGTLAVIKTIHLSCNTTTVLITKLAGFILYDFWLYAFTYPHLLGPQANVTIRTVDWCK